MRALVLIATFLLAPATALADVRIVRTGGDVTPVTVGSAPTPLHELLTTADVQPFELDFLDVVAAGKAPLRLTRSQAFARNDAALLSQTGADARFEYDGDSVRAPRLTLRLGEGSPLAVTVTASPAQVDAGEPVTLEAAVTGVDDGETPSVNWTFPDGAPREEGDRVTHRFETAGTFNVVVGVRTEADPAGVSKIVAVVVGKPPKATPTPTATPTRTPDPVPGVAGTGGGGGSGSGVTAAPTAAATPPTPEAAATPTPAPPFGPRVEGRLLATGPAAPAPVAPAAPAAAAAAKPAGDDAGGGLDIPSEAVAAFALVALAYAGFAVDMRRARARWVRTA